MDTIYNTYNVLNNAHATLPKLLTSKFKNCNCNNMQITLTNQGYSFEINPTTIGNITYNPLKILFTLKIIHGTKIAHNTIHNTQYPTTDTTQYDSLENLVNTLKTL